MSASPQILIGERCYRFRRYWLFTSVAGTVFFTAAAIAGPWAAWSNIDGSFDYPGQHALLFAVFFSCFAALSVWLVITSIRHQLRITHDTMTEVGIVVSRTIQLADVTEVRWRVSGSRGVSVHITTPARRIAISFGFYTTEQQRELIAFCRTRFHSELQRDWTKFNDFYLKKSPKRRRTIRRVNTIVAWSLASSAVFNIALAKRGLGLATLILGAIFTLPSVWVNHRRRDRKDRWP